LALVQAFVNTRDIEGDTDELVSPDLLVRWLEDHGLVGEDAMLTQADLVLAIEIRETLRQYLASDRTGMNPQLLDMLNHAARIAPLELVFDANGLSLEPAGKGFEHALGRLFAVIAHAAATGRWQRLKTCRNPHCRWAYYDSSRNRSSAWCSMQTCGSRAKARRFRERHRRVSRPT
jgi:predicted RNA-binding Zn ribbon-like protein